jgi:hypothetical protein
MQNHFPENSYPPDQNKIEVNEIQIQIQFCESSKTMPALTVL